MKSKTLITLIMLLLLLAAMSIQVFAMEPATVEIPFTVKNAPGTVVIEAVNDEPLPTQTAFDGVSSGKFELIFTEPGEYNYRISHKPGTEQGVTYDKTVYEVWISVRVKQDGTLYALSAYNKQGSPDKTDGIEFENILPPPSPTPAPGSNPKTGDNNNLSLWIVLMLVSVLGLAGILLTRKKSK